MSANDRRAQLVEALRPKLGLRQHMAEPLADALLPLVQKIEAELNANSERIAELEAELKDANNAYWREREQHEADRLAKDTEIGRLRRELAEANRRYEERTPTQWAYEQACHALEKHRERAEQAEVKLANTKRLLDNRVQDCVDLAQRAERAEAELEQWRACFGETALKDARGVLAERDQLREAVERVRQALAKWDEDTVHDADALGFLLDDLRAALGQVPAAEQVNRTLEEALDIIDGQFAEDRAAEQDGGEA